MQKSLSVSNGQRANLLSQDVAVYPIAAQSGVGVHSALAVSIIFVFGASTHSKIIIYRWDFLMLIFLIQKLHIFSLCRNINTNFVNCQILIKKGKEFLYNLNVEMHSLIGYKQDKFEIMIF